MRLNEIRNRKNHLVQKIFINKSREIKCAWKAVGHISVFQDTRFTTCVIALPWRICICANAINYYKAYSMKSLHISTLNHFPLGKKVPDSHTPSYKVIRLDQGNKGHINPLQLFFNYVLAWMKGSWVVRIQYKQETLKVLN